MNNLNTLSKEIYEGNKRRGFDTAKENIGQSLMLVVSELAEALEADRKDRRARTEPFETDMKAAPNGFEINFGAWVKDTFEDEIADAIIRLFDLCGALDIDIERHIELKLKYNETREFRHGKKY